MNLQMSSIFLHDPEGLTEIGDEAFEGTGAEVVIVPESCVTIGSRAFANAVKLEEIYIPSGVAEIADDAFAGIEGQITIFCQPGSYADIYAESKGILRAPTEQ